MSVDISKNPDKMSERELRLEVKQTRPALIAIRANTAPDAISLSPRNRIRAIYHITVEAIGEPDGKSSA